MRSSWLGLGRLVSVGMLGLGIFVLPFYMEGCCHNCPDASNPECPMDGGVDAAPDAEVAYPCETDRVVAQVKECLVTECPDGGETPLCIPGCCKTFGQNYEGGQLEQARACVPACVPR